MSAKRTARLLGPYEVRGGWRVLEVHPDGTRTAQLLDTEERAKRYIELYAAALATEERTVAVAVDAYAAHLADKGTKPASIEVTRWAIGHMFPDDAIALRSLKASTCAAAYEDLRTRPSARTGAPLAADTHRNALAQSKSFLGFCAERGWIPANPLAAVKGIGRRRPRGKSLGKAGNELHIRQARLWRDKALQLASAGDHGATAALVALLLGMRASEVISRRVGDLDDDGAVADVLWIPCAKTPAGRRALKVPPELQPLLAELAAGKAPQRFLFECERKRRDEIGMGKPHTRDWIRDQVHRICDLAQLPRITAHACRGLLATVATEQGMAGVLVAQTLGHADARTTMSAYARPGAAAAGDRRRGLGVLDGGLAAGATSK